jgi:hypothetical protein
VGIGGYGSKFSGFIISLLKFLTRLPIIGFLKWHFFLHATSIGMILVVGFFLGGGLMLNISAAHLPVCVTY